MITTIKNDNSNLYKDLFQKASEVLSGYERTQTFDETKTYYYKDSDTNTFIELIYESEEKEEKLYEFANALTQYGYLYVSNGKNPSDYNFVPELGITTLEEYYNWLPEIKRDAEGKPTIFTKLPLDEAHFEINLNTRAINIPAEFKKNGIGVQGDDLAEVVYFMTDRYFDAMDLNNTEIYIEWETPKGANGPVKSVSETYLKLIDDENYPGKIIFGWAISEAITKESGVLKFAVRFVKWDEKNGKREIVYSFNTLTAQVTIHPNLGLDLENYIQDGNEADNCNDRLLERIEPSVVVGGAQAAIPYFLKDLVVLEDGYDIEDNHTTGTYDLSVVATADDTGVVSYVWKRAELSKDNVASDAWIEITENFELKMVALTKEELAAFEYKLPTNHIYHLDDGNGTYKPLQRGFYDLTDANTITNLGDIDNIVIYEQRAILTVENYGAYRAEARNRIFNSLTKKTSNVVMFKRPAPIVMDNSEQTTDNHIVNEASATLAPVVVESIGDLAYKWYRVEDDVLEEIEGANESSYTAEEPGYYKLEITRTRNRDSVSGYSIEYRVTNAPAVPVYTEDTYNGQINFTVQGLELERELMSIEWESDIESDGFEVTWYLYKDSAEKDLEIVTYKITDEHISTFNPTKYLEVFEKAGENNIEGFYYALVKNKLNGVESDYSEKPEKVNMLLVTD